MPFADSAGTSIHYDLRGAGDTLLLVPGLGGTVAQLAPLAEALSTSHRVISVDPRCGGESDKPDSPLTGELLAADMAAVLDHAGVGSAHFVGISFGGMIGQELALAHPQRVRSLLLASSYGASDAWTEHLWLARLMLLERLGLQEHFQVALMFLHSPRVFREHPETIARIQAAFAAAPPDPGGYRRQLEYCRRHDARARLGAVRAPTLVMTGSEDILSPPAMGRALAELIPGARFQEVADGAHLFMLLQPVAFAEQVRGWLREATG